MAVFTAIGAYVVGALGGAAVLGTVGAVIVGGIVATGAAMLTSRLINGSAGGASGAGAAAEQGTRVQLQPDPQNKIPVLYGEAYCSGMVTDAWLDNDNKTMTYVLTIAETCNNSSAVYSVLTNSNGPEIYYNDLRLDFDGSNQAKAIRGKKVVNGPGEDHTDDNFAADGGRVFINIYAGDSTRRIWGNTANAYDIQYLADHWDSNRRMEGLIFAVVQINYDSAKGFTGLPQMTFRLKNSIDNPADVLKDYLTSNRYGAGVPLSAVDTTSFNLLENISNEDVSYTPVGGGTAVTQKRYRINGLIDTSRSCMDNIETIILNCGSWLSYDVSLGQWRVIPKRELPGTTWSGAGKTGNVVSEPAPAFVFSDDNIVSGINISSTRLDNLYNAADVDFYDRTNKDQRGYVKLDLRLSNPGLLNYNEPGNSLKLTFDLVNNNVQAERLANLELKQSRDDLVVTFTTSHYGLQAQAGDVIGVVNELYGWTGTKYPYGKYFRVLKTVERPAGEGVVSEINAIEYNADVYADESITEFTTSANIGIAPRESSGTVLPPSNDGVTVESNPYDPVPNIVVNVLIPTAGGPYDEVQIYVAEETIGSFPALSQYKYLISEFPSPPQDTFTPDTEQSIIITSLPANQAGKQYYIRVRLGIDGIYGEFSDPDLAILPPVTGNYNPSEGSTTAAAGGNLGNIKVGVDPDRNTITTVVGPLVLDSFDNNIAINANMVYFQNNSTAGLRGIVGTVANNDQWFVGGAALGGTSDAGAMVIASGNNGTEPILARQYSGNQSFGPINSTSTIANEVTLLDAGGNSSFPKNVTVGLDLAVNGGGAGGTADITSTAPTGNLFNNEGVVTVNIGNGATNAVNIGRNDSDSKVLIKPGTIVGERNTQNVFNTVATTVNAFGAATAVNIGANTGVTTINHDLTVQGGNINLNGVATAAQQPFITFEQQPDGANSMYGIRGISTTDDPWFIGAGSTGDDLGYLEIATGDNSGGLNNGGEIYVRQYSGQLIGGPPWLGGSGTIQHELILLDNVGDTYIPNNTTIGGDLTVNGTTTTINSTVVTVDDKNIELASTASPTDITSDGGGITLRGDSNKLLYWANSPSKRWMFDNGTGGLYPGVRPMVVSLNDLYNVNDNSETNSATKKGQILFFDGTEWVNGSNTISYYNPSFPQSGFNIIRHTREGYFMSDTGTNVRSSMGLVKYDNSSSLLEMRGRGGPGLTLGVRGIDGSLDFAMIGAARNASGTGDDIVFDVSSDSFSTNRVNVAKFSTSQINLNRGHVTMTPGGVGRVAINDERTDTHSLSVQGTGGSLLAKKDTIAGGASATTVDYPLRLERLSAGIPAPGIGCGIQFVTDMGLSAVPNQKIVGSTIESIATDTTVTTEDYDFVVKTRGAGTLTTRLTLNSVGKLTLTNDVETSGRISSAGLNSANGTQAINIANTTADVTFVNDIRINGNTIRNSAGLDTLQFDAAGNVTLSNGILRTTGIGSPSQTTNAITISNINGVTINQNLRLAGDLEDGAGFDIIRSDGFNNYTFAPIAPRVQIGGNSTTNTVIEGTVDIADGIITGSAINSSVFNTSAGTCNIAGMSNAVNIGKPTVGTTTLNSLNTVVTGTLGLDKQDLVENTFQCDAFSHASYFQVGSAMKTCTLGPGAVNGQIKVLSIDQWLTGGRMTISILDGYAQWASTGAYIVLSRLGHSVSLMMVNGKWAIMGTSGSVNGIAPTISS